jgi:predicted Zn finger-like uncharacterized protein
MGLAVPCPHCQAVLRVPSAQVAGAIGKKAKCSQCGERFVIPDPAALPGNPVESPLAEPIFAPEPEPEALPPAAAEPVATGDNPFGFDAGGESVVVPRNSASTARRKPGKPAAPSAAGPKSKMPLILAAVAGLLLFGCAGLGAAVYFLAFAKPAPVAVTTRPDKKPAEVQRPERPPEKELPPIPPPSDTPSAATPTNPSASPAVPAPASAGGPFAFAELPKPRDKGRNLLSQADVKFTLDVPFADVEAARFGVARPGAIAVLWRSNPGFQGLGVQESIDLYVKGVRASRVEFPADGLPPGPRKFDLAAKADFAAVEAPAGKLTLIDLTAGTVTAAGVEPFPRFPDAKPLGFVRFVDGSLFATLDAAGRGQVWDARTGKPTESALPKGPGEPLGPGMSHFEAGRGYAYAGPTLLEFHAAKDAVGTDPKPVPDLSAAAYAPGAGAVAVATAGPADLAAAFAAPAGGFKLLCGTTKPGGSPPAPVAFPAALGPVDDLAFVSPGQLLAVFTAGRTRVTLFDLTAKVPAAVATAATPVLAFADPAARKLWWFLPDPADAQKTLARAANAELPNFKTAFTEAKVAGKPAAFVLTAQAIEK